MKTYTGGCHCGAVRFEVAMELGTVFECNCSHCQKKGFLLSFVPRESFTLTTSEDMLMEYLFNKKAIRHLFCRVCGVQSFAEGLTMPQVAVNVRCLDDVDLDTLTREAVSGRDI